MKSLRRFSGLGGALFAGLLSSAAFAQNVSAPLVATVGTHDAVQIVPNGNPAPTNVYGNQPIMQSWILGGNVIHSGVPVLTGCAAGTTTLGAISGTDFAWTFKGGDTASTSCIVTFATAFNATPICTVSSQTAYGTTTPSYTVSKTAVTITQASEASEVYNGICIASPNG